MNGDRDDTPRVRPDLAPELVPVAQALDEAARAERALIEQASRLEDAPGTDRVGPTLRQLAAAADAGEAPGPRTARPRGLARRLALVAAAAAALVVLLFVVDRNEPAGPGPSGVPLGSGGLEIVRPRAGAAVWDTVEWVDASGAARRFELRVLDPAREGPDATLVHEIGLETTRWTPADPAAWPREIRIEIDAYDASDAWLGSASASYSR